MNVVAGQKTIQGVNSSGRQAIVEAMDFFSEHKNLSRSRRICILGF